MLPNTFGVFFLGQLKIVDFNEAHRAHASGFLLNYIRVQASTQGSESRNGKGVIKTIKDYVSTAELHSIGW